MPVDITLDALPDDAFATAKQLLETLGNPPRNGAGLEPAEGGCVGDFGYSVRVGDHDDRSRSLTTIFRGVFARQPKVVIELEKVFEGLR